MALELLKIDCFIYAYCFNICLYMPTVLYMHTKSSCKLINHISSIAHLNCQQIGFISYHIVNIVLLMLVFYHIVLINGFISQNTLAAALNYTAGCYFYTTMLLLFYYCSILLQCWLLLCPLPYTLRNYYCYQLAASYSTCCQLLTYYYQLAI